MVVGGVSARCNTFGDDIPAGFFDSMQEGGDDQSHLYPYRFVFFHPFDLHFILPSPRETPQ